MSTSAHALQRAQSLLATIPLSAQCTANLPPWQLALLSVRERLVGVRGVVDVVQYADFLPPALRSCAARLEEAAVLVAPESLSLAETMIEASVVLWLAVPDVARGAATARQFLGMAHAAPERHPRVLGLLGVSSSDALHALLPGPS